MDDDADSLRDRRGVRKAKDARTGVILEKMSSWGDSSSSTLIEDLVQVVGSPRTWRPALSGLEEILGGVKIRVRNSFVPLKKDSSVL